MEIDIQNIFTNKLPSDTNSSNEVRKVFEACYSKVNPTPPSNPQLIHYNSELLEILAISDEETHNGDFTSVFSGKKIYPNSIPYAMCYGGHQFGVWAGQLGDGRAINLFEVISKDNIYTFQLKGAGQTPYSRTADGLAVLRSSIREYLCAEAMHHLNVPSTRSLSLIKTGDKVLRDILYSGNPAFEDGAVVCRVAPSFIRFGNFEIFASRNDTKTLQLLTDYTIEHFFPEIISEGKQKYLDFFRAVAQKTLKMIVEWQRVGFVHGVMNTDNMSIHGITIDYGPYGWLEDYDPNWTPNTTDSQHRYCYGNQPEISLWNLYQLANALYPIINTTEELETILNGYEENYQKQYLNMMREKLGLVVTIESDNELIQQLTQLIAISEIDYTIFFRKIGNLNKLDSFESFYLILTESSYDTSKITETILTDWKTWYLNYVNRLQLETLSDTDRKKKMDLINPKYVLRNYMAHLAIEKAEEGDYSIVNELFDLLRKPYDEQPELEKWFSKRPDWAKTKVGCSMLSCSS